MILKSYELEKKKLDNYSFFLLYGNNKGLIEETIEKNFKSISKNIFNYDESEILKNTNDFIEQILNKSFFDSEKLIIVSRVTDKIFSIIEDLKDKKLDDIYIILKSNSLEKKSKIRNFFEKNSDTVCIPFYEDNNQTLSSLALKFFQEKKINISQQNINLLIQRSKGDRMNLKNELNKIELFLLNKKKIEVSEILKLTNLAENFELTDLVDNALAKNKRRILTILNENNFVPEDCIIIFRVYLSKLKRLLKIQEEITKFKDVDKAISLFKPPIFWKDKELVKQQIKILNYEKIKDLIKEISKLELNIKKEPLLSIKITTNFLLEQAI